MRPRQAYAGAAYSVAVVALCAVAFVAAADAPPVKLHDPPVSRLPEKPKPPVAFTIHAGTLIDGTGAAPRRNVSIVVRDGRIAEVGPNATVSGPTYDWSHLTVLPGFIDCHTHLTSLAGSDYETRAVKQSAAFRGAFGAASARATIEAGFTTVRDVGADHFADVGLKRAIDQGLIVGPRMICATNALSIIGGHGDNNGYVPGVLEGGVPYERGIVVGPDDARSAVRYALKHGAEVIKIMATGGVLSQGDAVTARQFSDDELRAIVDEANHAGVKVCAHAHGEAGMEAAVRAGVASIEHGTYLSDRMVRLMREKGCYLVPTRMAGESVLEGAHAGRLPGWAAEKARQVAPIMRDSFARAVRGGVKIAFGTDAGVFPHGLNGREFRLLTEGGMTPMQAIVSATGNASDLLGRRDVGRIAAGAHADFVAVEGDPLRDISRLEQPKIVMKGGAIVFERALSAAELRQVPPDAHPVDPAASRR